jgi:hypothetical protein
VTTNDKAIQPIESDQIHNLPTRLERYFPELLLNYWDVERMSYTNQAPPDRRAAWESLGRRLQNQVEALASSGSLP